MENKNVYCILCGAENKAEAKFCTSCGKPMEQKDDELFTYTADKVKGGIKDTVKEKTENAFLALLEKLVNSYLYGIVLSVSIVMAAGAVIAGGTPAPTVTEFDNSNLLFEPVMRDVSHTNIIADFGIYASYGVSLDGGGNITDSYIVLETISDPSFERHVNLYNSAGVVIATENDVYMDQFIPIDDYNCVVEVIESPYMGDITRTMRTSLHSNGTVKQQSEYWDGLLYREYLYYENGVTKEEFRYSEDSTGVPSTSRSYYNEDGKLTGIYGTKDGKPDSRREIVYGDSYEYTYIYGYDENSTEYLSSQYVKEFDENGWEIRRGWLNGDGTVKEMTYIEYYDSGRMKTSDTYYGETLTNHSEYEEDGSYTLYRYANGEVYKIEKYNANGGLLSEEQVG